MCRYIELRKVGVRSSGARARLGHGASCLSLGVSRVSRLARIASMGVVTGGVCECVCARLTDCAVWVCAVWCRLSRQHPANTQLVSHVARAAGRTEARGGHELATRAREAKSLPRECVMPECVIGSLTGRPRGRGVRRLSRIGGAGGAGPGAPPRAGARRRDLF
jgi:hypothetical protein